MMTNTWYLGVFHLQLSLRYLAQIHFHYSQTTQPFSSNVHKRNFYDLCKRKIIRLQKIDSFFNIVSIQPVTGSGLRDVFL